MADNHAAYDEVRRSIRLAANGLFQRLGFDRTRIKDISDAVGKTKSSFYYYYKSKEAIFLDILREESEAIVTSLFNAVRREKEIDLKLRAYFKTLMRGLCKLPLLKHIILDGYAQRTSRFVEDAYSSFVRSSNEILTSILSEGYQRGMLEFVSIEKAAGSVMTAIRGMEVSLLLENAEPDDADTDVLVDILINGMRKR